MPHHPADVGSGEHGLPRLAAVDVLEGGGERHRIAAGIALRSLRLSGGAGGVEDIGRLARFDPDNRHLVVPMLRAEFPIIQIAARLELKIRIQATIDDDQLFGWRLRDPDGFIEHGLIKDCAPAAQSSVCRDHQLRPRVVDARCEAVRGKAAEHHRMDRSQPRTGEHREHRLGDHRHVDQHPVAAAHAERADHAGAAIDLGMQLPEGVALLLPGLGGNVDECFLPAARREMAVYRVVAQIGEPADKPLRERRPAVVEDFPEWLVPVDELGLLRPELFFMLDRAPVEFLICTHSASPEK